MAKQELQGEIDQNYAFFNWRLPDLMRDHRGGTRCCTTKPWSEYTTRCGMLKRPEKGSFQTGFFPSRK